MNGGTARGGRPGQEFDHHQFQQLGVTTFRACPPRCPTVVICEWQHDLVIRLASSLTTLLLVGVGDIDVAGVAECPVAML